jgi:hypothetical protein
VLPKLRCASAFAGLIYISVAWTTNNASAVTAEVAKKCSALTAKAFPPRVIGNPAAGSAVGMRLFEPCMPRPAKKPPGAPAGFTRSSTTAFASWHRGTSQACGSSPATDKLRRSLPHDCRRSRELACTVMFIDGKAIVVDKTGLSVFDLIRSRQHDRTAVLYALELIELDGEDLRASGRASQRAGPFWMRHRKSDGSSRCCELCALIRP